MDQAERLRRVQRVLNAQRHRLRDDITLQEVAEVVLILSGEIQALKQRIQILEERR